MKPSRVSHGSCEDLNAPPRSTDPNQEVPTAEPAASADIHEGMAVSIFRHERSSLNYPCVDTVNELITNHFYLFLIM